jgi:hypothetical protein
MPLALACSHRSIRNTIPQGLRESRTRKPAHLVKLIEDLLRPRSSLPCLNIALLHRIEKPIQLCIKSSPSLQVPSNDVKNCTCVFRVAFVEVVNQVLQPQNLTLDPRHLVEYRLHLTDSLPFFLVALPDWSEQSFQVFDMLVAAGMSFSDELE